MFLVRGTALRLLAFVLFAGVVLGGHHMQFDLVLEPRRLLHAETLKVPASFALCRASGPGAGDFTQKFFQMDQLDTLLRELPGDPDFSNTHTWISQNTLRPHARNRRVGSVILLNAVWVDIDLRHPPQAFTDAGLKVPHGGAEGLTQVDAHLSAELLLMDLEGEGLPTPTCIIGTGGGLCAKWVFDQPIPSSARARWTSLQRHLVERVGAIRGDLAGYGLEGGWAWPVDKKASDAARILRVVNSYNPRWGAACRMIWDEGREHDFNVVADQVLPYTQDEVNAWRAQSATWKGWDKNRAKASAASLVRARVPGHHGAHEHLLEDEAVRDLWTSRFELGRLHLANRGGPAVGERNSTWWAMAVALAWSCGDEQNLQRSLAALHQDLYQSKGWTWGEALAAASSVIGKLRAGAGYKFKTTTWLEAMGISSAEASRLRPEGSAGNGHNAKRAEWTHGTMGFERLSGLEFNDWKVIVRDRQAQAGRRSAEVRVTTVGPEKHRKAQELAAGGLSQRKVAALLGVNQSTVARWLRDE